MRDKLLLFTVVGKAALITTVGSFALVLGFKIAVTPVEQGILGATMAIPSNRDCSLVDVSKSG
jgi:hypothetical protein